MDEFIQKLPPFHHSFIHVDDIQANYKTMEMNFQAIGKMSYKKVKHRYRDAMLLFGKIDLR